MVFSVDRLTMSLSERPLAPAVDHIAAHTLFRQVRMMIAMTEWQFPWPGLTWFYFFAMWCPPPAPCSPQGLRAVTDCRTSSLLAFWNTSLGSTSYTATVTGPNGLSETCSSSNLTCSVSGLQCASQYNVKVTSQDDHCTSSPSQIVATTGCVYIFS